MTRRTAARAVHKQAYYIEPDKIGRKAFYLLRSVLQEKGLTAICKVVIRDREALAAIDPFEDTMVLTTLHWPDEIRSARSSTCRPRSSTSSPPSARWPSKFVEAMTDDFDATKYKDEYREALLQVIEAKVGGVEIEAPAPQEESASLVDLMKLLQDSVERRPTRRRRARRSRWPRRRRSASRGRRPRGRRPTKTAAKAGADEDEAEEARPARRRKSA